MLDTIEYPTSNEYRTGSNNEPIAFFLEVLPKSARFDLLLGYFSSSAINVLSLGFAQFISKGGTVRMVTNHVLSPRDKDAIIEGHQTPVTDYEFSHRDYLRIKNALDDYGTHFFRCLAWLIASRKVQILIVKPKGTRGIAHYKSGVFYDKEGRAVKFKSSCNFTAFGLLENLEELEIKKSWTGKPEKAAVEEYEKYFEEIWQHQASFIEYLSVYDIESAIVQDFGNRTIEELIVDEEKLLRQKKKILSNYKVQAVIAAQEEAISQLTTSFAKEPSFPYSKPRGYQSEAYKNWVKNGKKGIFAMATGTGKTLTALNCVLNEYRESGSYRGIIVVPTLELVSQWEEEIRGFNFRNIVSVSSQNRNWRNDLRRLASLSATDNSYSFFIITTYKSFTHSRFQRALFSLPSDTLFIADEAHNLASSGTSSHLEDFPLQKRIGLSATPERVYDPEGTSLLEKFFSDTRPYVFEYSMKEALEKGFLCNYCYYPILVELSPEEIQKYTEISLQLASLFDREDRVSQDALKRKLLLRKQIIHKASNKLDAFDKLIKKLGQGNKLKHTLVYAPEGYYDVLSEESESLSALNEEEYKICEIYASRIRSLMPSTRVALFNAETKKRAFILEEFADSAIDVLVSMKCLDEGVDVPRTEQAIFCASTGNPRQFIQRRGRILRPHADKHLATIYDMVVVPSVTNVIGNYNTEKRLIENELKRVYEFASLAVNQFEALDAVQSVLDLYNIKK